MSLQDLLRRKRKKRKKLKNAPVSVGFRVKVAIGRLNKLIRGERKKLRTRRGEWASKHFRIREFDCRSGDPVPREAYPALRHLCKTYLEPLRREYGAVHINSGYRTTSYNRAIGGATNSEHIYDATPGGVAADITCRNASPAQVQAFLEKKNPGGLGVYATFTHVDNRDRDGKPRARWTG